MTLYDWFLILVAGPFSTLGLLGLLILWIWVFGMVLRDFFEKD